MKKIIIFLGVSFLLGSCSHKNDIDNIVSNEWERCNMNNNYIIDFANLMNFEWDTMCFYSNANSLEDINKDLGFELEDYIDIGDRIIFLYKGRVVYYKEWFPIPSKPPEGVVFITDFKKFRVSKSDAKFKIQKKGKLFCLEKI